MTIYEMCVTILNIISFLGFFFFKYSHLDFPTKLVNFDQTSGSGVKYKDIKQET